MEKKNKDIRIDNFQDDRVWIHSYKLNYGAWIYNSQLEQLILENTLDKNIG